MSEFFPSLPDNLVMGDLYRAFPKSWSALCDYHDRILRDHSDLTIAERELIAAYVSGLNACTYCYGAHVLAAQAFGLDVAVFEGLIEDINTAKVDDKMKPLLAFAKKMTLDQTKITPSDAQKVYDAGWSEAALFDAISVVCLFSFMNRLIEATGLRENPLAQPREIQEKRIRNIGGDDLEKYRNAHEAPPSYARLPAIWASEKTGGEGNL